MSNDPHATAEEQGHLAVYLARKIFECPVMAKRDEVKRIAFKGESERDFGGLCEDALVGVIRRALEARLS